MMNLDYIDLWDAFSGGDDGAFRELYSLCYPELLAFGRRRSTDMEQVKDAINQTFAYFWEKRASLGQVRAPKSYIYTSFLHKLSAVTGGRESLLVSFDRLPEEPGDVHTSPEHQLILRKEESSLQQRIDQAISKLSARKRELIRLRYYEGLSHEEICKRTGLSSRTVYNKLFESVRFLRAELQVHYPKERGFVASLTAFGSFF